MPEERLVYGCVGADRPEALPFIDEVDGLLVRSSRPCCRDEAAAPGGIAAVHGKATAGDPRPNPRLSMASWHSSH